MSVRIASLSSFIGTFSRGFVAAPQDLDRGPSNRPVARERVTRAELVELFDLCDAPVYDKQEALRASEEHERKTFELIRKNMYQED